jgi:IPT/TIG domain
MMYPINRLVLCFLTRVGMSIAMINVASAGQPVIDSFSPTSGPGGTVITITGSDFTGANYAGVGGYGADLMIISDTDANITVPGANPTGGAALSIGNPTNVGFSTANFMVTGQEAPPVITSLSPASGPVGTIVTINGNNLGGVVTGRIVGIVSSSGQIAGNFENTVQWTVPTTATAGSGLIAIRTAAGTGYSSTTFQVTNAPPSILNNTAHIVDDAISGLNVLGVANSGTSGPTSSTLAVNQTCAGNCVNFLSIPAAITAATTPTAVNYAAGSSTVVSEAVPYQIINQSSSGYVLSNDQYLSGVVDPALVYSMAYCGTPAAGDYPPVSFVTVLPNNDAAVTVGSTGCGYAQGIEFSIPVSPAGCTTCTWTPIVGGGSMDVSSPSATTEAMSAVLAALKVNHPQWTWGDIKSVLRTTASNWATGYTPYAANGPAFGYGNINFPAANGYTGQIYLQSPGLSVVSVGSSLRFDVYPFLTSRRVGEVVYGFTSMPVLPSPGSNNEYTYAQISALAAQYSGSIFLTTTGLDTQPFSSYFPKPTGPLYLVAFTVDQLPDYTHASFSRAESYSILGPSF